MRPTATLFSAHRSICDVARVQSGYFSRDQDIQKIVSTLDNFKHVDTFEPEPEVDIPVVRKEIATLKNELAAVDKERNGYLKELGL